MSEINSCKPLTFPFFRKAVMDINSRFSTKNMEQEIDRILEQEPSECSEEKTRERDRALMKGARLKRRAEDYFYQANFAHLFLSSLFSEFGFEEEKRNVFYTPISASPSSVFRKEKPNPKQGPGFSLEYRRGVGDRKERIRVSGYGFCYCFSFFESGKSGAKFRLESFNLLSFLRQVSFFMEDLDTDVDLTLNSCFRILFHRNRKKAVRPETHEAAIRGLGMLHMCRFQIPVFEKDGNAFLNLKHVLGYEAPAKEKACLSFVEQGTKETLKSGPLSLCAFDLFYPVADEEGKTRFSDSRLAYQSDDGVYYSYKDDATANIGIISSNPVSLVSTFEATLDLMKQVSK